MDPTWNLFAKHWGKDSKKLNLSHRGTFIHAAKQNTKEDGFVQSQRGEIADLIFFGEKIVGILSQLRSFLGDALQEFGIPHKELPQSGVLDVGADALLETLYCRGLPYFLTGLVSANNYLHRMRGDSCPFTAASSAFGAAF